MSVYKQKHTTTTTGTTWKECHTGVNLVFTTHDGIEVYAGGSSRSGGWWLMENPPDLAMGPDSEVLKGMPKGNASRGLETASWPCMDKIEIAEPPKNLLAMDFPDFNVPADLGKEFWEQLVIDIRKNKVKTIHCMCMGGHGRTGVQLAILRYLLATKKEREEWENAYDVVMAIRGPYCDKAVEATKQQEYVADMCGIPAGPALSFHKAQYGTTTTTYGKSPVKKTNFNTKLLECTICDFTCWEDPLQELGKGDWCYDFGCKGKLTDVHEYCIDRNKVSIEKDACLCLNCLQPVSDIQIMSVNHLNGNLMEVLHGEDWSKLLTSQMKLNPAGNLKGKLLRNLAETLLEVDDEKTPDNVVVVDSCILCNFNMKSNSDAPDYEKGDKGYVHHVKCDYCYRKVSPHILTMALDVKSNTNCKACPECIAESKSQFFFSDNITEEDGKIIDGVSPHRWLRLTHIEVFNAVKDKEAGVITNDKKESEDDETPEPQPTNSKGVNEDDYKL